MNSTDDSTGAAAAPAHTSDHHHVEACVLAAQWLADQSEAPQPIIPIIRERFGLTALQASEACALSRRYRINRKAFG